MAVIRLDHVSRRFGGVAAIDDVSLEVRDHEVVTIVGPSGCGKSTLLRIIAGLEQPSSGAVLIDGQRMNDVPTHQRNLAMVFQSYALYPHMTCFDNLALNLRLKKIPEDQVARRVQETARTLAIEELLHKKPRQLSGGQRQRVAVGRALIRKPRAFLFDEPLSNLDALLRERVRHELKQLFDKLQATVVYVTHDQIEALTLAHRVVVLDGGRIQQSGAPDELYRFPANRFVATFIGSPSMNIFDAAFQDGRFVLGETTINAGLSLSGVADIGIRPEAIRLDGTIPANVAWVESLGFNALVGLRLGGVTLTALAPRAPEADRVHIAFEAADIHVFDKNTGANIRHAGNRSSVRS
jgi:ABC-type sugar transport system ATPase subunit